MLPDQISALQSLSSLLPPPKKKEPTQVIESNCHHKKALEISLYWNSVMAWKCQQVLIVAQVFIPNYLCVTHI